MRPPHHRRSRTLIGVLALLLLGIGGGLALTRVAALRPEAARAASPAAAANATAVPTAAFVRLAGALPGAAVPSLFRYEQPANAAELTATTRAPALAMHYVTLDRAMIEAKQSPFWQAPGQGRFSLPLPGGRSFIVAIDGSESLGPRRFTSVGRIEGRPLSRAVFAYNEGFMDGHVEDPELGSYELRVVTDTLQQFYQVDPKVAALCRVKDVVPDADAIAQVARRKQASAGEGGGSPDFTPPTMASNYGTNVEVHLMMLYTQGVLSTTSPSARAAAVQTRFDSMVATLNDDLARSLCAVRVRLVRIAEVTMPGDELSASQTGWQDTVLEAARLTTDGQMDELHALRDQAGADLVVVAQDRFDPSSAGIAYLFQSEPGLKVFNPPFAFGVVDYNASISSRVFSHEMGHLFGSAHNREDSGGQGAFSYSYGYRYVAPSGARFRDIMSYDDDDPATPTYTRLAYFSTPLVTPPQTPGQPIGIPVGQTGEADTALAIDQTSFEISTYRLQTQAPYAVGLLNAVSTRAFVGSNTEQQLIGAFILTGTPGTTKRVLMKGVGPGLSGALGNFLADPLLTLWRLDVSPNVVVATNDNWGGSSPNSNQAAIVAAGGTPLVAGSRDAALLMDLPVGTYSANVTSASPGTGVSLVEVYEVGASSNKIFALSTRGFADKGREMIAGIIINGAPGTTKRVIIRAQGPSMGRPPSNVPNTMNDPLLQLHNATGDLILVNDDWADTSTTADGFSPRVTFYSEQQIFDSGMAPGNRREPCIMVDLAPGIYTAILRPFESLPTQPAQGGVALIEVYEVN